MKQLVLLFAFVFLLCVAYVLGKPSVQGKSGQLGALRRNARIINGEAASPGEITYQVSYQYGFFGIWEHVCGASIVSPTWAVTAGHCITELPELAEYRIVAGITNLYETTAELQEIAVTRRIYNPAFGGGVGPNDIALLGLQTPLVFGDLVQPIRLPAPGDEPTGEALLTGWGAINDIIIPIMPDDLQKVTVPILSFEECNAAIDALLEVGEENPLSEESNVCTGPLTGGISACSGDSGGPLAQNGTLVGVVSWGFIPCGSDGAPSVFTKTSSFVAFILDYVTDLPK